MWDGDNLIYEYTSNKYNCPPVYECILYNYGLDLISQTDTLSDTHILFTQNAHGDVADMLSVTSGELNRIERKEFDAFGNGGSTLYSPMGYAGQYHDAETGFVYLRARYYNPAIGRFINEDPIRDGLNWYVYCGNNPVRFVDPSGYITEEEIEMFENGEMAPMAYTYLMGLTYMWYYVDTQEEKDDIHQLAEDFRANDYTTTNGEFLTVDQGIAFMPTRPDGTYTMTREEHFFRNELNIQLEWEDFEKLQEKLPKSLKWEELDYVESVFHKFDLRNFKYAPQGNNRKYVSACGHFEAVYTKENYLLGPDLHSPYMGTYNYYSYKDSKMHTKYDVDTWWKWGTVPDNN